MSLCVQIVYAYMHNDAPWMGNRKMPIILMRALYISHSKIQNLHFAVFAEVCDAQCCVKPRKKVPDYGERN